MTDRARRRVRMSARQASAVHPSFEGWIRLASSGWYIQVSDLLDHPSAGVLMADDAAWQFAVTDWLHRRPPIWRRRLRRTWLAEEQYLAAQATRLERTSTRLRTLRPARDVAR